MKRIIPFFIISAAAVLFSGCATLFTGTTQSVTIDSEPRGANIIVDGLYMGTTPSRIRLNRDLNAFIDDGKYIRLEKDGFIPDGYRMGVDVEPFSVLNTFMVFFWAIDAATGAIMRYDNDYYNFLLVPQNGNSGYQNQYGKQPVVPYASQVPDEAEEEEDNYQKLMKLVDLYEDGLLTKEEFEIEKAKIFERKD